MRFVIFTNMFYPDRGGGASVFSDLCYGLVEKGHEVEVVTTFPYYPEWKNKTGKGILATQHEIVRGVSVHRYGIYIPKNPSNLIARLLYELSFAASTLRYIHRIRKSDLVMAYCPLIGGIPTALLIKIIARAKFWINIQDIPADAAAATGIVKNALFSRAAQFVQSWLFRRGDIVSTISPVMVTRIEQILGGNRTPLLLPNWLNESMAQAIKETNRATNGIHYPTRFLYAGNIGKKQGLLSFCRFLSATKLNFAFSIFGDGGEAQAIRDWHENSKDSRFTIGPFLSERDFVTQLMCHDFFVITETPDVGASFIPSKLIPSMGCGTPIIAVCSKEGPLGQEVDHYQLGMRIDWNNLESLAVNLEHLSQTPEDWNRLSRNNLERSIAYLRETNISKVANYRLL